MTTQTEDDKKKLAQRIVKLFSLGDASRNQSEAEVEAAVTKARQLMAEHDLSMADLQKLGGQHAKAVAEKIVSAGCYTLKQKFAGYDDHMAIAVGSITSTKSYTQIRWDNGHRFWTRVFVGTETDTAVATQLFVVMMTQMRTMARNRCGAGWGKLHSSYCWGYATKVMSRAATCDLQLTDGQSQTLALVLRDKSHAIDDWMEKAGIKEKKSRKIKVHSEAYHAGTVDGSVVDVGDPRRRI